ncbi:hypothetical protein PUNSTDRAFT_97478 [Punctularia strigosozonata HHB-11173 SS5]|uniref:uncharacterized protein n=1 Tax=Punctularia strigosozonata (strain HHB-11173) TaxID=741275 RepID=UPI00044170BA|nr:uncharacterized protein PUNSTDRAFT_97478 [Punctularia strigosozonata HHB-11173 SS5]EIN12672.1 hypothetical protein PUNSTDRAFT_97478 [Punctularia strigosozonata HHB-11173 SS5]
MDLRTIFYVLLTIPSLSFALEQPQARGAPYSPRHPLNRRAIPSDGFYNPLSNGGAMLTQVSNTFPAGQGEPLNAIISANSDKAVLVDQSTSGGLRNYFTSLGFSSECLGQHSGSDQAANLGDGNGYLNETAVIRWDYGDPALGTCQETIKGGNHFRYWVQNGKSAKSNAVFLGVSYEKPISDDHDIIFNGYNLGRDWLVGNATGGQSIPTLNLTNSSTYSGSTSYNGYSYKTDVSYVSGLLQNTSIGINHNLTVGGNGINACDGLVAVLTVKITAAPAGSKSAASRLQMPALAWTLLCQLTLITLIGLPIYTSL